MMAESGSSSLEKKAKSIQSGPLSPQFINLTNSLDLDPSTRTKVRVQVMREHHRRRASRLNNKPAPVTALVPLRPKPALNVRAQTKKFRLGREKELQPWVPVKMQQRKRYEAKEAERIALEEQRLRKSAERLARRQSRQSPQKNFPSPPVGFAGKGKEVDEYEDEFSLENADSPYMQQLLSYVDYSIQRETLSKSPASGDMDPFCSSSLLLTPKTQRLLHFYCTLSPIPMATFHFSALTTLISQSTTDFVLLG